MKDPQEHMAILAHELSTPIASIAVAAQILAKDCDGHAARRALAIADEARQVLALLDSLTDLAALDSGRLETSARPIDLVDVIRATVAFFDAPDHHLSVDAPADAIVVHADERRIRQVLRNLLANATKYCPPGTPIGIRAVAVPEGSSALIQVSDRGPGVPPEERGRLFRKFARLSTAGGTRGSGLGLYLCRAIVEDHGGEMWAEFPDEGGTVFAFTLPLAVGIAGQTASGASTRA